MNFCVNLALGLTPWAFLWFGMDFGGRGRTRGSAPTELMTFRHHLAEDDKLGDEKMG
ncbi:MAG: hypothetical protein UW16_C0040G0003 [Microgenomates group bacterium GW2011_GWC1_44_10]|nr:MAG: hypothetical protein UW16_C0040G0003 [Microgenomates group bacterium GW2011_GWC1_44_10]